MRHLCSRHPTDGADVAREAGKCYRGLCAISMAKNAKTRQVLIDVSAAKTEGLSLVTINTRVRCAGRGVLRQSHAVL